MVNISVVALWLVVAVYSPIDAILVKPSKLSGGCNDSFYAAGDGTTGLFWQGPDGMAFCKVGESFNFVVNGECTGESISCDTRIPSGLNGVAAGLTKHAPKRLKTSRWKKYPNRPPNVVADRVRSSRKNLKDRSSTQSIFNLVLMIKFKDHLELDLPPVEDYDTLFNSMDGPDGRVVFTQSVKEYYLKQSNNKFNLSNVLTGWIEVSLTEVEASGGCTVVDGKEVCCNGTCDDERVTDAIKEGITKFEEKVGKSNLSNFGLVGRLNAVDMLTVIHSGFGAESLGGEGVLKNSIWSHHYNYLNWKECGLLSKDSCGPFLAPMSKFPFNPYNINPGRWFNGKLNELPKKNHITHFGVIAHEIGHILGLPNFYDKDFSSSGLGQYCLMGNPWGLDFSQNYPSSLSGVAKYMLHWVDAEEIYKVGPGQRPFHRTVTLTDVHVSQKVAKFTFSESEYLIVENRQPKSTDALMDGGILVFHVDETQLTNDHELEPNKPFSWATTHPIARLIQPDNLYQLELGANDYDDGDWFPSGKLQILGDNLVPSPNVNSYQKLGVPSGLSFANFTDSGETMQFDFSAIDVTVSEPPTPTSSPMHQSIVPNLAARHSSLITYLPLLSLLY